MSRATSAFTSSAVRLLLAVIESPLAQMSAATARKQPAESARLAKAGMIKLSGHEPVITPTDDFSDEPVSLSWDQDKGSFGYFHEVLGWREVPHDRVKPYGADISAFLGILTHKCSLIGKSEELVPRHLWHLGFMRIGKRPKRTPVLFGRRLYDSDVWSKIQTVLRDKPSEERRVILTSTDPSRLPGELRGCTVIAVTDAVRSSEQLAVDPVIVTLRYDKIDVAAAQGPLVVLGNGAEVRLLGRTYLFPRGLKQRKIVCYMYQKYLQGQRWTSSSEIAAEVDLADTTRIRDVFKKSAAWGKLLTEREGMCSFCLPDTA
jgi:hypothetical protein